MTDITNFDLHAKKLLNGTAILRAGAGTGKTYNLERLYVRMLCELKTLDENPVSVAEVLAVTFTEKAAAEMKDRIRKYIYGCVYGTELNKLYENTKKPILTQYKANLERALGDFDRAAIYTIHGFCNKILTEYPVESGFSGITNITDEEDLLARSVRECLRKHAAAGKLTHDMITWLMSNFSTTRAAESSGLSSIEKTFIEVIRKNILLTSSYCLFPDPKHIPSYTAIEKEIKKSLKDIKQTAETIGIQDWKSCFSKIGKTTDKGFTTITEFDITDEPLNCSLIIKGLSGLLAGRVDDRTGYEENVFPLKVLFKTVHGDFFQKIYKTLENVYFLEFIQLFAGIQDPASISILSSDILLNYNKIKEKENILVFDDLLYKVRDALTADNSNLLPLLKDKYAGILIDEFQDTDAVQWEIFKTIRGNRNDFPLFLIGDPKQAIYGFRGGDIATYFSVENEIDIPERIFSLSNNYRSQENLVNFFNYIFNKVFTRNIAGLSFITPENMKTEITDKGNKFLGALKKHLMTNSFYRLCRPEKEGSSPEKKMQLTYDPVTAAAAKENNVQFIALDNFHTDKRVTVVTLDEPEEKSISVEKIRRRHRTYIAGEIHALLGKNVPANEIAVLCDNNKNCSMMQETLSAYGIKAVLSRQGSIWQTREAAELRIFLDGVVHYRSAVKLKTALTSVILGIDEANIADIDNGNGIEVWAESFEKWHELLFAGKVYEVIMRALTFDPEQNLTDNADFFKRVLSGYNGERIVSNILHMAELLGELQRKEKYDGYSLLREFTRLCAEAPGGALPEDNRQVRIDSDLKAVQILTLHACKGLQWEAVFISNTDSYTPSNPLGEFYFENRRNFLLSNRLTNSSQLGNAIKAKIQQQIQEEKERLFYVGFTRAKSLLYIPYYKKKSFLNTFYKKKKWLIDNNDVFNTDIEKHICITGYLPDWHCNAEEALQGSKNINQINTDIIQYKPPNPEKLLKHKKVASFSGLTVDLEHHQSSGGVINNIIEENKGSDDEIHDEEASDKNPSEINRFNFAVGAQIGSLLHQIFENIAFSAVSDKSIDEFYIDTDLDVFFKNQAAGFYDAKWYNENGRFLKDITYHTLSSPVGGSLGDTSLRFIRSNCRKHELEFLLPMNKIDLNVSGTGFNSIHIKTTADGYLKGFIDLIFLHEGKYYVADWKSNVLGDSFIDYTHESMKKSMQEHSYFLQYRIYSLGLCAFLKNRISDFDYDRDFGGAYYFYIRGMSAATPGTGVYFDRPGKKEMKQLEKKLCKGEII
jgi:exodeoxyribonuclease V beta subunit